MSDTNVKPTTPLTSIYSLDELIACYATALTELESASPHPSLEQIVAVLVARDAIEKTRAAKRNLTGESITTLIRLDSRLKAQAQVISTNKSLSEWKEHMSIPPTHWWWNLKSLESSDSNSPLQQAIERCDRALSKLEGTRRRNRTSKHILEVLLARDQVAQHQCEEQLFSETLIKITELDQRLKKQRLTILRTKELPVWKSCLNPASENWWWDLKLNLLGSEDEPMTIKDRLWIAGAVMTTVIAAAILLNTGQVFKIFGGDKNAVQADTLQNTLFGLQGTLVTALGGALTTGKGRRALESVLINTPFVRPNWQAPGLFGVSCLVLGGIGATHYSLPKLGDWYLWRGNNLVEEAQYSQAQAKYLQAKKLFTKDEDVVKVSLALGKVYEHKVDFLDAIEEYKSAKGTDDPEILNRLGRVIVLQEMRKVGWKKPVTDQEKLSDAENYIDRAYKKIQHDLKKEQTKENLNSPGSDQTKTKNDLDQQRVVSWDEQTRVNKQRVHKEILISQGILDWAQVDFTKLRSSDATDTKLPSNVEFSFSPYPLISPSLYSTYLPSLNKTRDQLLEDAQKKFKEADEYEENLPTTPDGRTARCYAELAEKLLTQKNQSSENTTDLPSNCQNMIDRGLNDPSDAFIIKAVLDVVSPTEASQSASLNTPNSTQESNE